MNILYIVAGCSLVVVGCTKSVFLLQPEVDILMHPLSASGDIPLFLGASCAYELYRMKYGSMKPLEKIVDIYKQLFFIELPKPTPQLLAYQVLGLSIGSNDEEVKKKFHQLALTAHPDRGGSHEEFVKINNAYDLLSQK